MVDTGSMYFVRDGLAMGLLQSTFTKISVYEIAQIDLLLIFLFAEQSLSLASGLMQRFLFSPLHCFPPFMVQFNNFNYSQNRPKILVDSILYRRFFLPFVGWNSPGLYY